MKPIPTAFEAFYAEPSRNGVYKPSQFRGHGVKMVKMGELFGHEFIGTQDMERIELSSAELERSGLRDGDLLFGRRSVVESGAGKCSLVVEPTEALTFESSIIRVRLERDKANPRFFHYYFAAPQGRSLVRTIVSGAAVKGIRGSDLAKLVVTVPPLPAQDATASVLKAYDDLIENNRRRITLLEEASRQLYREWFVRLRFPGYEHTRITNGLPEGWENTTAFTAMEVLSGGTPMTTVPDYWSGDIPFYTPKDAADTCYVIHTARAITELGLKNCNSRLYDTDTVFVSARGTVGKLNLAYRPMAMSQSCYALIGKGHVSQFFLYCALQESIEHLKQHAGGAVFDAIVVDTFKRIRFVVPDIRNVRSFEDSVAPIFRQVGNLLQQNEKLGTARELLLTRFMSGEIAA